MNITVFAASSGQAPDVYVQTARQLGEAIARRGHTLLNGAGRTGLMGASADACLAAGGRAVGIIPQFMIEQAWEHRGMTELVVTRDMHERKEQMSGRADACIALPGGVGTMEELLEIITWKQLGLFLKPIVILNVAGYFDPLLEQLQRAVDERFMRPQHAAIWCVADTAEEAVRLAETTPLWDSSIRKLAAL
ncbi:MAG: TIGR00730 family Rossman fold protein [Alloprevotella sp.]|nr:TIGR00730 family Rossman fold protein [Alloprevotella sp.]